MVTLNNAPPGEPRPLRVAALTGGRYLPSARFRVRQYQPGLRSLGIQVEEHFPAIPKDARLPAWPESWRQGWAGPFLGAWLGAKLATRVSGIRASRKAQVTWLQRSLLPGLPSLEGWLGSPLVLDLDDAIWLTPPMGERTLRRIAERASLILAGNAFLAEFFSGLTTPIHILPTAVDTERYRPAPGRQPGQPFTLGWIGTKGNLPSLQTIERPLARFLRRHPKTRLQICSDAFPRLPELPAGQLSFLPWTPEGEVPALQGLDVGLMPLPDTPWSQGKCSYKMLQYMACGIPVIVSPVGMNQDVLKLGLAGLAARNAKEWEEALEALLQDPGDFGQEGRRVACDHFSLMTLIPRLATHLRQAQADLA